jgi:selenocysteine-specific elongation factor
MPGNQTATIRALQNHNEPIERARPGQRVAVNLRHVDRDEVRRGDVLAFPGSISPATRLDAELRLLEDAAGPVKNGTVVRLLTGTTEAMARLRLLDRRVVRPGETVMAQLNLDRAIATRVSEYFLIRSYSPTYTIGGGRILEVNAKRHRRYDQSVTDRLETVASGDLGGIVRQRLQSAGAHGIFLEQLATELGIGQSEVGQIIDDLASIDVNDNLSVSARDYALLLDEIVATIEGFHRHQPYKYGIDLGSLTGSLASISGADVIRHAVKELVEQKILLNLNEVFRIAGHDPFAGLSDVQRKTAVEIEQVFLGSGIEWQSPEVVAGSDQTRRGVLRLLVETGRLVRLKTLDRNAEMIIHSTVLEQAKRVIEQNFPAPASFALKDIRDLLGSTRKYIVPLMEHLDATGVTVRSGDLRRLRQ